VTDYKVLKERPTENEDPQTRTLEITLLPFVWKMVDDAANEEGWTAEELISEFLNCCFDW